MNTHLIAVVEQLKFNYMKKNYLWILLPFLLAIAFSSCQDKTFETYTYVANVPQYMSLEEMRSAIKVEAPRNLENPGKIYFKGGKIYISESFKGIHVIDNSNPSNPQNIAIINIPGNVDIAIKGNILYADSYMDLVAIDISDLNKIVIKKRVENVFPRSLPPFDSKYPVAPIDEEKGVVVGWKIEKITVKQELNNEFYWYGKGGILMDAAESGSGERTTYFVPNAVGIAGSMARFQIYDNYLYTINNREITVFNIANTSDPVKGSTVGTTRIIETLFIYNQKMFIGSTTGMLVYELSNPANPKYLSEFSHITSCDPVVVQGDYAYVTLRSGSGCGNLKDQLNVISIKDIYNPYLVKDYELVNPYGLGIDGNVLFVCDGTAGLKVYDATDPLHIDENLIKQFSDLHAFDVIPFNKVLMLIGNTGLYQYDYSDINNLVLLSVIPIEK